MQQLGWPAFGEGNHLAGVALGLTEGLRARHDRYDDCIVCTKSEMCVVKSLNKLALEYEWLFREQVSAHFYFSSFSF